MILSSSSSSSSIALKASHSSFSFSSSASTFNALKNSNGLSFVRYPKRNVVVFASKEGSKKGTSEIVFEPFEEVKKELLLVPTVPQASLAPPKDSSEEERQHAEKLMEYQNKRGGKVRLQSMLMPWSEFDHSEKGDALYAMELALSLEKLNNEKLLNLHTIGNENNDVHLVDFVESEFLTEQVEAIKKISEYVAQLRRVGRGHGVWNFDQMLLQDAVGA
uniref:Ferritin n=1 Tax=Fagus sylvatica TaxID=28930 RepID=A0A2N9FIE6_FAGSY